MISNEIAFFSEKYAMENHGRQVRKPVVEELF